MYFYTLLIILSFNYSKLGDLPFFFRFIFVLSSEKIKLVTFRTINILFFFVTTVPRSVAHNEGGKLRGSGQCVRGNVDNNVFHATVVPLSFTSRREIDVRARFLSRFRYKK